MKSFRLSIQFEFWRLLAVCFLFLMNATTTSFASDESRQKFPDVMSVKVRTSGPDTFNFDVTISSPYDTPQRYADAFHVINKDGNIFGERILVHDHADEQPFQRDLYFVKIPAGVREVIVQARDQKYGYGGKQVVVILPGR